MAKDLQIAVLYDFYGDMLTEKQQEVIELYYNEDLSLAEIAAHASITRQGVRDSIKRAEHQLSAFEELLGLAARFRMVEETLGTITRLTKEIAQINKQGGFCEQITKNTDQITKLIAQMDINI